MKRKNTSLNVLKGICAILIVFNHCKFPGTFGLLIEGYSRIAVPIFFMISGYYSYKNDKIKLKKKIKHIFILLIGSSLFYLVFNCLRYTILNDTNSLKLYLHNFFKLKSIIKCIMLNENHFWPHLWFLNALLYVYIIQYFVSEKQKYFPEKVLSYILLSSYLVLNFLVIKDDFSNAILIRNFIFVGIPFFLIGKNIRFSELEKKVSNKQLIILSSISFLLLNFEILNIKSELFLGSIIISITLFIFAIKNPNYNSKYLCYIGEKLGLYTYVLHPAIKYVVLDLYSMYSISGTALDFMYPIIVLILTITISFGIYKSLALLKKYDNEYVNKTQ